MVFYSPDSPGGRTNDLIGHTHMAEAPERVARLILDFVTNSES
jgi:hypothetical protein